VPSFSGQTFKGTIARVGGSLDSGTRTMPVELNVSNQDRRLAPGMYAEVLWPVVHKSASLLVPKTSIVKTTERTFVIRIREGLVQWCDVKTGGQLEDLVEVFGDLQAGDTVAVRGTDELKAGTHVQPTEAAAVTRATTMSQ